MPVPLRSIAAGDLVVSSQKSVITCNRCGTEFPESVRSFWRERVMACASCGSRHQRESRLSRAASWAVAFPLVVAFAAGWLALFVTLVLFSFNEGRLSLGSVGSLLALAIVALYPGKYIFGAIKGLSAPREVMCLEK